MVGGGGGKFGKVWVENLNKPDQKYFPLSRFFFLVFQILSGVLQVIKFQIFSSRNFSNQIKSMPKVWGRCGLWAWQCDAVKVKII